ncbi:D-alanyl-D-alanine carboxypeptidase [Halobacillus alkaliphilus]|uniref:D-alanyl-D-alanine carboxypeptidase n=2 Tax=Halobacillus alkaliphilus TaxID=396056 RepID=A0A1I2T1N6_9BACI|nr:M15 family metallopeptidase [Halobacillus alkaliphilus]SFG58974.1 D-alanyl-D-alanine carboxypeptidase [Halobacillus alkaliphilus]
MSMKQLLFISISLLSILLSACSLTETSSEEKDQAEPAPASDKEIDSKEKPAFKSETGEPGTDSSQEKESGESSQNQQESNETSEEGLAIVENPESIKVVVNKNRKLPEGYTPPDLTIPNVPFYFDEELPKKQMRKEAADALEKLFQAADQAGQDLVAASGYRSYERQKNLFEGYIEEYGEEKAKTFSARPGTSEHQTGLAMDVTSAKMSFKLDESFRDTKEGEWLAEHAHEYGFIIRYPEGKQEITGYTYEPWHLRYVGKNVSSEIHKAEETLEEFFGLYLSES